MIFLLFKNIELNKKHTITHTPMNKWSLTSSWSISELWLFFNLWNLTSDLFVNCKLWPSVYCPIPPVSCSCIQTVWRRTPCPQRARGDKSDNPRPGMRCGPVGSHWKIHKYKCNTSHIHTITGNPVKYMYIQIGISKIIPSKIPNMFVFIFLCSENLSDGDIF